MSMSDSWYLNIFTWRKNYQVEKFGGPDLHTDSIIVYLMYCSTLLKKAVDHICSNLDGKGDSVNSHFIRRF